MLIPADTYALHGSRFMPHGRDAVARISARRPVILETIQYQLLPQNQTSIFVSHTVDAGVLQYGSQIRIRAYGTVTNTSGLDRIFAPVLRITQLENAGAQIVGYLSRVSAISPQAWELDSVVSFSRAGAYLASGKKAPGGSDVLVAGGFLKFLRTNASFDSPDQAGGNIITGSAITDSLMASTKDPNASFIFSAQPVGISLELETGADVTATVVGGWMEGL